MSAGVGSGQGKCIERDEIDEWMRSALWLSFRVRPSVVWSRSEFVRCVVPSCPAFESSVNDLTGSVCPGCHCPRPHESDAGDLGRRLAAMLRRES
jgi:hypothetical protein